MNKMHKSVAHAVVSKTDSSEVQWDLCSWQHSPTSRTSRRCYSWLDFGQS